MKEFVDRLADVEVAAIVAGMKEVAEFGLPAARHLRGDLYEVRADGRRSFRVLFAAEGRFGQVLLALSGFAKETQRTPLREIRLAESRLADWRARGEVRRQRRSRSGPHRSKT